MTAQKGYPIGQQDFKTLRNNGNVYIDKTHFIERILRSGNQYFFLARPRRFGKSLFLSTLRYFFEGERDLFKNLYIDSVEWTWEKYPVLYLDLNTGEYSDPNNLDQLLDKKLRCWEEKYGIEVKDVTLSLRFQTIIESVHKTTGRQVVILVDEYDKPLVRNLNNDEVFDSYRSKLSALYSNFKSCAPHIKFVFLTGVSRFSKLSIFSDLNNINDITFDENYADICGITTKELQGNLSFGICQIAGKYGLSYDEVCEKLKVNYDGYRFHENGSEIYNPWSILNCLSKQEVVNYWNETGVPTLVAESLQRIDADIEAVLNSECDKNTLRGLDLRSANPLALLYQTGYLTIKEYDPEYETYTLGIPNREVREGLLGVLLPYYVKVRRGTVSDTVYKLVKSVRTGNANEFMVCLQAYFAGIPYDLEMDNENNFHNAFYILMTTLNLNVKAEAKTSDGRMDLLLESRKYVYIIELKYDGSAREALAQINNKNYALQFKSDTRQVIKIGVNFSSKSRCINDWIIEK